ncbi:MAG: hypothetical protein DHS20C16_15920 [Phycisphaerae bacterium]|nr:MAG: hypothetical protein DHS20C16_15920 [Phycisphaerae bacterium]
MNWKLGLRTVVWFIVFGCPLALCAHPGPHHDIARVSKLVEAEPHRAELWIERAYHRRLAEQYDEALADLAEAERLAPGTSELCAHRGMTLSAMGRDAEAESELNRFLEETSGTAGTFSERAQIRQRAGRLDEAVTDLAAAIKLKPDVAYFVQRGRLQEKLKRWDDVASGYREGIAKVGQVATLNHGLIRAEVARGNHDEALTLIDGVMEHTKVKTPWQLQRADVLESAGKPEAALTERLAALEETNRVLAKRPTAIQLVIRARVYMALERTEDARRDLELTLKKTPRYEAAIELLNALESKRNQNRHERPTKEVKSNAMLDEK